MAGSAALVCGPGYEYYRLADQLRSCVPEVEELTRAVSAVRATDWQSPSGEAFKACLVEHMYALEALRMDLLGAAALVDRYAADAAAQQLARNAGS